MEPVGHRSDGASAVIAVMEPGAVIAVMEPAASPGGDIKLVVSEDVGATWGLPQLIYAHEADGGVPKATLRGCMGFVGRAKGVCNAYGNF
ncbi:hypothetical protein CYMTET_19262 [Cymbomonas tetramitiformis]|uniref:Exo-alpha-sialidase n=1 Tax=Cymbomonas tetramitiformis TaxID=36881 RepID=A0AAE0G6K5_9CHLO|nr:hypothetical protein CYMTET_19262 [Cymbomonas tetramitiformis]